MGNKGPIVVKYAGDLRELERSNKAGVKIVEKFGTDAGKAGGKSGKAAGKKFGDGFEGSAKSAGKRGAEAFGSSLKVAGVAVATAAGAAIAVAAGDAMEKEKLGDKVAASLNLSGPQARKAGKVASALYADAFGENMPEVSDAVESVMSSIDDMAKASPRKLKTVTAGVMNVANAFDSDAQTAARDLGILIKTGLVKDATQGLDLITATLQKVPKAMRGDASDAIEEYSQFFADLGFSGKQSMELLVSATKGGKYGIDKMGDAIKEFSIRSVDGSSLTDSAFKKIGFSSDDMANKFLKGGKTSKDAFDKTVRGLLGIKDPAQRAQAAVALFGTPLEDLGVKGIPKFLQSLLDAEGGLGKVEGRSKKMGDTLNDNVASRFDSAKRKAQTFLSDGLLALWDGFDTGKAKGDGFAGAVSEVGASLKPVAEFLKSITEVPGFSKIAGKLVAIGAGVGALAVVYKFSGLSFLANTLIPDLGNNAKTAAIKLGPLVASAAILAELTAEANKLHPEESGWMTFIKSPIRGFNAGLKNTLDLFKGIGDWINGIDWLKGIPTDKEVGDAFSSFGRESEKTASSVGGWFSRMSRKASGSFANMKDRGVQRFSEFKGEASKKASEINSNVSGWFSRTKTSVGNKLTDMKESGSRTWSRFKTNTSNKAREISESVRSKFGDMKEKGSKKLRDLRSDAANIFERMKDGASDKARRLSENVRRTFGDMKDKAGKKFREFWNGLKSAAAKPVKFIVNTVWNDGLRKMLNAIPGVDIEPTKLKFRHGGPVNGPGTGTSDSIDAKLSKGEHVWTAKEVAAVGGQKVMYGMRKAALRGELEFAKGGEVSGEAIARAQAFARQQAGKPYGWGAVGPSAYDCSGFMSALTNVLRGRSPYSRVGSTASFPWAGFEKGPGQFTIGSSKNFSGGIGHMAGNLAGMGVESRGGRGVILGGGAMSPSRFNSVYHLGKGGKMAGGGNWWDDLKAITSTMSKLPGQIREMMSSDSWMAPFLKKMARSVAQDVATFINKKIPDIGPIKTNPVKVPTFDRGGTLAPGFNTVYNGLGRPESLRRTDDPTAGRRQVVYVNLDGAMGKEVLRLIRKEIKTGGGDPLIVLGRGH